LADSGDLVISARLQKKFDWVVECKHVRDWNLQWLMPPNKEVCRWRAQAKDAALRTAIKVPHGPLRPWLLVMRGNFTPEYCLFYVELPKRVLDCPTERLVIPDGAGYLIGMRFAAFLEWRYQERVSN
jgi:hypothetical protein